MLVVASLWAVRSLSSQRLGMRLSQDRETLLFLLWTPGCSWETSPPQLPCI